MNEDLSNKLIDLLQTQHKEQKDEIEKLTKNVDKLEKKVDDLITFKNRLITIGVILSALFGFLWDFFKTFFSSKQG